MNKAAISNLLSHFRVDIAARAGYSGAEIVVLLSSVRVAALVCSLWQSKANVAANDLSVVSCAPIVWYVVLLSMQQLD